MASNLTNQVRGITGIMKGVAAGDLTKIETGDARGEMRGLEEAVNSVVDRLSTFASERQQNA